MVIGRVHQAENEALLVNRRPRFKLAKILVLFSLSLNFLFGCLMIEVGLAASIIGIGTLISKSLTFLSGVKAKFNSASLPSAFSLVSFPRSKLL